MFYVVYNKENNVVLQWQNDQSVGVPFLTAEQYRDRYAKEKSIDADSVDVIIMPVPEVLPTPHSNIINTQTLTFSPNLNYQPPVSSSN